MKKIIFLLFIVLNFSCDKKQNSDSNEVTTPSIQTEEIISLKENEEEKNEEESKIKQDFETEIEQNNLEIIFKNDSDVLQYLAGKTFTQKEGKTYISFSFDGANLSGQRDYQWLSYESLGGFKGVVKLSSTSMDNPDGVLTLWVSSKDNAVTDGTIVLLYK